MTAGSSLDNCIDIPRRRIGEQVKPLLVAWALKHMDPRHAAVTLTRALLSAGLLVIAACAGNGEGLDDNGNPIASSGETPPLSAEFSSIQANIFTPICSVCHVGGGAPEGLRLDAADSYNLLVGVPSTEVPSLMRVKPGDPDSSYIIQKLQGTAAVGGRMPLGGPYLSADQIAFIQQWIANGASPSDSSTAANAAKSAHFAITSVVPDATEPVSASPPQIMIAFNKDLDVSQINLQTARVDRLARSDASPGEASPGEGSPIDEMVPARISVSSDNLKALMIWPSKVLAIGHYRLVIVTSSRSPFTDTEGESIGWLQNEAGEFVIGTFDVESLP